MTRSVEIPEAGETAAFEALRAHEDASYWNSQGCHCGATFETSELLHRHIANSVVAAALPYLAPAAETEGCTFCGYPSLYQGGCTNCGASAAPAGDGGLREALEEILKQRAVKGKGTVTNSQLRELLAAHPAAPAVPQPADERPLRAALEKYFSNGGPDTPIRTTWHAEVEHWEAPAEDIRELIEGSAVPQPVDREALERAISKSVGNWGKPAEDAADAVLALLNGEGDS